MSDYVVADDKLKKMLKIAKKRPMPFAYCPGQSPETDLLGLHRKKNGAIMGKALRAEGDGNKIAFGTLSVEGKLVTLECERILPALAKKLKKFLKFNKVLRNVRVLDADGNVLEEDIEDLPEDAEEDGEDAADTDLDEIEPEEDGDAGAEADSADIRAEDARAFDAGALAARIKALEPRISELGDEKNGKPLHKALVEAAGFLKAGDGARAESVLDRIDAVLTKLAESSAAAAAQAQPQPGAVSQQKLQKAAAKLAQRVKALPEGDVRTMLANQVRDVAGAIQEGAIERAIAGLKTLRTDLDQSERNLEQDGAEETAQPSAAPAEPKGDPLEIWNEAKSQTDTAIGRLQERLKQEGNPELDRIAEYGLNGVTEGNQVGLMKRLFDYNAASPPDRAAAAGRLAEQTSEYRKFLAGSELIALCEQNPFVSVDIRGPLDAALSKIEDAVKPQSA